MKITINKDQAALLSHLLVLNAIDQAMLDAEDIYFKREAADYVSNCIKDSFEILRQIIPEGGLQHIECELDKVREKITQKLGHMKCK